MRNLGLIQFKHYRLRYTPYQETFIPYLVWQKQNKERNKPYKEINKPY